MNAISPQQLKTLHTLLGITGLKEHKAEMVGGTTNGRTESTRELTEAEAADIINALQKIANQQRSAPPDAMVKMRKKADSDGKGNGMGDCPPASWRVS